MKSALIALIVVGFVGIAFGSQPNWVPSAEAEVYSRFTQFKSDFDRRYDSLNEEIKRFQFFKENMKKSAVLNDLHNGSATFGPTIFSDLSYEEFASTYLSGLTTPPDMSNYTVYKPPLLGYPTAVNWATSGKVTPVKNQGSCGSCWAFTAVGEMESQLLIAGRGTYSLAPQQLVDCSTKDGGCQGGFYDTAWSYVYSTGGIMNSADYPYIDGRGSCKFNSAKVAARLRSPTALKCGTTAANVYEFLSSHGPAAAALAADPLQNYQKGVLNMNPAYCGSLNHGVMLTGYDSAAPSLTVRNSWGPYWGENGFFRITPSSCLISNYVMGSQIQ